MNTGMDNHSRSHSGIGGIVIAVLMILLILLGLTPGRLDGNSQTTQSNASGGVPAIFHD